VNFIEELRRFLDFIQQYPGSFWLLAYDGLESMRVSGKFQIQRSVEQVQADGFRKRMP
jgi:hypothetical protein